MIEQAFLNKYMRDSNELRNSVGRGRPKPGVFIFKPLVHSHTEGPSWSYFVVRKKPEEKKSLKVSLKIYFFTF